MRSPHCPHIRYLRFPHIIISLSSPGYHAQPYCLLLCTSQSMNDNPERLLSLPHCCRWVDHWMQNMVFRLPLAENNKMQFTEIKLKCYEIGLKSAAATPNVFYLAIAGLFRIFPTRQSYIAIKYYHVPALTCPHWKYILIGHGDRDLDKVSLQIPRYLHWVSTYIRPSASAKHRSTDLRWVGTYRQSYWWNLKKRSWARGLCISSELTLGVVLQNHGATTWYEFSVVYYNLSLLSWLVYIITVNSC